LEKQNALEMSSAGADWMYRILHAYSIYLHINRVVYRTHVYILHGYMYVYANTQTDEAQNT
jgi:hypothetical protein